MAVLLAVGAAACSSDGNGEVEARDDETRDELRRAEEQRRDERRTVTLLTHDSFALSDGTLEAFTEQTGYQVTQLGVGDTGELVANAVLTRDNPLGDVLFGVDNTFLQRAIDADIFEPHQSPNLDGVPAELQLDAGTWRVTPIDYGDVCINWHNDGLDDPPTSLAELTDPRFADELVVSHPETSSPGLAFMLATIARFGDDWQQFWADLAANGVAVTAGWEDAYYGEFVAGGGDRNLVVSYASSPPAEVVFADPPIDAPPTGVLTDGCFRQIEFAGVLAGADNPEGARALIDFMLTETFQADMPLNMFVYPAVAATPLPDVFVEHTPDITDPLTLTPAEIEANRDAWTQAWVSTVLR